MIRPLHRILLVLAVLAVACAQVFGLGRGFLCDCGGVAEVTMADHCHGPHSTACHEHEEELCQQEGEHHEGGTHKHPAVVENLLASPVSDGHFVVSAPVQILFSMPEWQMNLRAERVQKAGCPCRCWSESDGVRWWPQVLAYAVVLRI